MTMPSWPAVLALPCLRLGWDGGKLEMAACIHLLPNRCHTYIHTRSYPQVNAGRQARTSRNRHSGCDSR